MKTSYKPSCPVAVMIFHLLKEFAVQHTCAGTRMYICNLPVCLSVGHLSLYVYMQECMYTCRHVCLHACMHLCIYVNTEILISYRS